MMLLFLTQLDMINGIVLLGSFQMGSLCIEPVQMLSGIQ